MWGRHAGRSQGVPGWWSRTGPCRSHRYLDRRRSIRVPRLRPRLTYANVIATLALFFALAGGAVAATQLPKGSVGISQLKREAVPPAKLSKAAKTNLAGAAGPAGPQGLQGPAGPKGDAGAKGDRGET